MAEPGGILRWIWRGYLRRHLPLILFAILLMSVEGALLGLLSYLVEPMFDKVLVAGQSDMIPMIAAGVFLVFTCRGLGRSASGWRWRWWDNAWPPRCRPIWWRIC